MGCPTCGSGGLFLKVMECANCRRHGCQNCGRGWTPLHTNPKSGDWACSQPCVYQWAYRLLPKYKSDVFERIHNVIPQAGKKDLILNPISGEASRILDTLYAQGLERQGYFDDAVTIYEFYQMEDEAQRVRGARDGALEFYLRILERRQKNVNFRCEKCGYGLAIPAGTRANTLANCFYCTKPLDMRAVMVFLKKQAEAP